MVSLDIPRFLPSGVFSYHSHKLNVNLPFVAATFGTGLIASFAVWCYRDYQDYLALGPGGPPYNVKGWGWITFGIRPFAMSKTGALYVKDYPQDGVHSSIEELPVRKGERAVLGGIAPHRQLSQHSPEIMRQFITNLFSNAAKQHSDLLHIQKSKYERHHDALFVSSELLASRDSANIPETAQIARGELGHAHPDLSVHLYLRPADARRIIEKSWAERHRLAVPKTSWIKNMYAVSDTYLMIYGPRNDAEMEVLRVILENSIRFMTGTENVQRIEWKTAL
ncbi:hypothetical protein VTL71DRAFT_15776 [Oculimacula yallundae]|uniref:Luciferase domain-containing protein n=1 Tax=Oculimacula yallundae TaxID=86028 RepID=A0ABR4CCM4_9HELO